MPQVTSGSEIAQLTRAARSDAVVKDLLLTAWSANAELLQTRLHEAATDSEHNAAKSWAIAAGIATEKTLLLAGQPTQLVGHLHAHRHDLSDIIDKLALIARRVSSKSDAIDTVVVSVDSGVDPTGATGQPVRVGHGRGGPSSTERSDK